ncbi:MAG TPA: NHL repeat-containing protein [Candidatus Binataceae bacterium]|nr:NHL repeat-containing protein [Candidatus Binataceae bacterium]
MYGRTFILLLAIVSVLTAPAFAMIINPAPKAVIVHHQGIGTVPDVVVTPTPVPVSGKAVLITAPASQHTVSGTVSIVLQLSSQTNQVNVFIDGVYLASTPPSTLSWDSTRVPNGIHEIDAEAFNTVGSFIGFDEIVVISNNPTPTPTRTPTAKPTPSKTATPKATPSIKQTPSPTPTPTPGPLFVSDQQNNRVLEYKRPFLNGMNASVVIGQPAFTASFPATTQSGLNFPWYVAQDSAGKLYVVDSGANRVLLFAPPFFSHQNASVVIGQADFVSSAPATTQSGLSFPAGVAVDKTGNLFVAERSNNRILEFTPPLSTGMNAITVIGQLSFTSSVAATTQSNLSFPAGLALDRAGDLFVADYSNNRVLEFKPPFLAGMKASIVIGQTSFTSRTAAVTASGLSGPLGVALDAAGDLFVADSHNNRVLEFKAPLATGESGNVIIGQAAFTTNAGATTASGLVFPAAVGLDGSGNLYVSDNVNDRVLEFEPPFSTGMAATAVIGEPDFTSAVSNTTQGGLSGPVGLVAKQP